MRRAFLICLLLTVAVAAQDRKVNVYVKPAAENAGGFVDATSKRVADSRADFVNHFGKDKAVALVDSPESADVVLEIVSSAEEPFGRETTSKLAPSIPGSTATQTETVKRPTLRIKLTVGEYEREFVGGGPAWRTAAYETSFQIRRWIKDNRQRLQQKP